jgi:hypothetical protein
MLRRSEIFRVQNPIAFAEHDVAFLAEVELLTDVAHIEQFLIVLLQLQRVQVEEGKRPNSQVGTP